MPIRLTGVLRTKKLMISFTCTCSLVLMLEMEKKFPINPSHDLSVDIAIM